MGTCGLLLLRRVWDPFLAFELFNSSWDFEEMRNGTLSDSNAYSS